MKLPNSYYNTISFFGSMIAGFCLLLLGFLYVITHLFDAGGAYIGLIFYIIVPIFLILGLVMIPIGMALKVRREKRTQVEETKWKIINLNDRRTRNAMVIFVIGTFVFIFISSLGSYQAFHYTESNEFCGTLCHEVMSPEYTAYEGSAHARVHCVECHVGEGASWYMRSKLSGLRQVYAVLTDHFARPIETPILDLRPARETCEKCHWPNKFYSYRLVNERSYLADSANTAWNVTLKMKTGSGLSAMGLKEGIHWHINPDVKIEYISLTHNKEAMPWVKYINTATGDSIIFQDQNNMLDASQMDTLEVREMDCMDCHNRPSHLYKSPTNYIDDGFNKGIIPHELPYFKKVAISVLNNRFGTKDSSINNIREGVVNAYENDYPEVFKHKRDLIDEAIEGLIVEFEKNCFPEMGVYHDAYTDHIGHQESLGCFRCHAGTHVSETGETIRKECNLCHSIVTQGPDIDSLIQVSPVDSSLEFWHPENIDKAWQEMPCSDCHSALY